MYCHQRRLDARIAAKKNVVLYTMKKQHGLISYLLAVGKKIFLRLVPFA